jgi:hypothetical protein
MNRKSTLLILSAALVLQAGSAFADTAVAYLAPNYKTVFTGNLDAVSPDGDFKSCGQAQLNALKAALAGSPDLSKLEVHVDISDFRSMPYHFEEAAIARLPWVSGYDAIVEQGVLKIHARIWGNQNCEVADSKSIASAVRQWKELSAPIAGDNALSNWMRSADVGTEPANAAADPRSGNLTQKPDAEPEYIHDHGIGKPSISGFAGDRE